MRDAIVAKVEARELVKLVDLIWHHGDAVEVQIELGGGDGHVEGHGLEALVAASHGAPRTRAVGWADTVVERAFALEFGLVEGREATALEALGLLASCVARLDGIALEVDGQPLQVAVAQKRVLPEVPINLIASTTVRASGE